MEKIDATEVNERVYEAPSCVELGTVEQVTLGATGAITDLSETFDIGVF